MTDKSELPSDSVVEDWERLTGCVKACGFDSLEAAVEHLADEHLTAEALAAQPRVDVREALGAHIHADAYRDTMPDDDNDAAYLRKQETWWRLQARAWLNGEVVHACAELAKKRATNAPEHKAAVAQALARIDTALAPTTQGTPDYSDEINSGQMDAIRSLAGGRNDTQGTDSGLAGELEDEDYEFLRKFLWCYSEYGSDESRARVNRILTALRTDHKAVLEEAAKVADRESVLASTGRSCSARSRRETADHIAHAIRALAEGAGK